jgi:hypothetical protein
MRRAAGRFKQPQQVPPTPSRMALQMALQTA